MPLMKLARPCLRNRRRAGELNTPDGFDLLLPDGSTLTHPVTG